MFPCYSRDMLNTIFFGVAEGLELEIYLDKNEKWSSP